jgi:hypothetical protein
VYASDFVLGGVAYNPVAAVEKYQGTDVVFADKDRPFLRNKTLQDFGGRGVVLAKGHDRQNILFF